MCASHFAALEWLGSMALVLHCSTMRPCEETVRELYVGGVLQLPLLVKGMNWGHGIISTCLGINIEISQRRNCVKTVSVTLKQTRQMDSEVLLLWSLISGRTFSFVVIFFFLTTCRWAALFYCVCLIMAGLVFWGFIFS